MSRTCKISRTLTSRIPSEDYCHELYRFSFVVLVVCSCCFFCLCCFCFIVLFFYLNATGAQQTGPVSPQQGGHVDIDYSLTTSGHFDSFTVILHGYKANVSQLAIRYPG